MSLLAWLTLSFTEGLGPVLSRRLIDRVGSVEAAVTANAALLREIEGIGSTKASAIAAALPAAREEAAKELDRAVAMSVAIVSVDDDQYPTLLRAIHGPPMILYVKGTLEPRDLHSVGVVGSRKCSVYGREQAERFGSNLAGVGVTVISGGARGIDTYAHRGALVPRNGRTIAVLGCGVDKVYPPENAELFDKIVASGGAMVSEFPLGTPPNAENFPRRNRIVSGLSRGILVVEADIKSGALITSKYATEHDRPVFALPGRVDNPLSAGPHNLIRDGAILTEKITDILDNLGPLPDSAGTTPATPAGQTPSQPELFDLKPPAVEAPAKPPTVSTNLAGLSERQAAIVASLTGETLDVDAIAERVGHPSHLVLGELTLLTLRGLVHRVDGQKFSRRA